MSEENLDGGSAFPFTASTREGMSLRDWFAGQALVSVSVGIVAQTQLESDTNKDKPETACQVLAMIAYAMADAMLAERKRP